MGTLRSSAAILRRGLSAARTPKEKAGWLGTLGNVGLEEDVPLVTGYAGDGDPAVRTAVANALRKTQTPAAEKTLLALVADTDSGVQDRALHTLTRYTLVPAHLDALREVVASGQLQQNNFGILVTLLEHNRYRPDATRQVLEALLEQVVTDQRLLRRIRELQIALRADGSAAWPGRRR